MPVDPVSLALGIGGLLFAFKGAVDGYVLFDAIVEKDNGSRYLALKYYVEKHKLTVWGDKFKLDDAENSPLNNETKETKLLVAGILAEISATHGLAKPFVKRYHMEEPQASSTDSHAASDLQDLRAKATEQRQEKSQKRRFLWATKDKAKFTELVHRYAELNRDLYAIVRPQERDILDTALASYLISSVADKASISALQTTAFGHGELLVLSAKLKELNLKPDSETARGVSWLSYSHLTLDGSTLPVPQAYSGAQRAMGYYHPDGEIDYRVWIEWKVISSQMSAPDKTRIFQRIEALGTLLSAPSANVMRVPHCIGIFEDEAFGKEAQGMQQRIGYAFEIPSNDFDPVSRPQTLSELIENTKGSPPHLGARIKLAYDLATSFSLFHGSRWLHKGFRSDNVLFFRAKNQVNEWSTSLNHPYIAGFDYSRPESETSVETRPTGNPYIDLYYHPDTIDGFTQQRDIYSLGVVLFEIALWRPLRDRFPKTKPGPLEKMTLPQIREFFLASIDVLGFQVGTIYRNVVRRCLTGDFGLEAGSDGVRMSRAFFSSVILELANCKV